MGLSSLIMTSIRLAVLARAGVKTLAGRHGGRGWQPPVEPDETGGRGWQPPVEPDNPEAVGIVKLAEAKENA